MVCVGKQMLVWVLSSKSISASYKVDPFNQSSTQVVMKLSQVPKNCRAKVERRPLWGLQMHPGARSCVELMWVGCGNLRRLPTASLMPVSNQTMGSMQHKGLQRQVKLGLRAKGPRMV